MGYPRVIVETKKIEQNVKAVLELMKKKDITLAAVTKGFCAFPEIAQAFIDGGAEYLADSRIENLKKLKDLDAPKMMLRLPMISEADELVKYADISLNSEIETIKALNKASEKLGKIHQIIIMVDLGDLREGYYKEEDLLDAVEEILKLEWIEIKGLGVNLTCYGGVIPKYDILSRLGELKETIEKKYKIELDIISGGNSSTIYLLDQELPKEINNLRLGESVILGTESAYGKVIKGTDQNPFTLEAQVIEVKSKPSVPTGEIGRDAFGQVPTFVDRGVRKRILCAVGKQDVDLETLFPLDEDLIILGGSSDHLILDGSDSKKDYKVGDIISFHMKYVSMLRIMTSEYIEKHVI
ncbi:MAG: ornithine racemase Orr [Gudongella sp.]|nr:ornithine racemase Orr [Gudongella sp.]